jgi:hypothetical protein
MFPHQVAKLFRAVRMYKPIFNNITGIPAGSKCTNQLSILNVIENTIIHFILFKNLSSGVATDTAHQYIWWHRVLNSISLRDIASESIQQWSAIVSSLFKHIDILLKNMLC